MRRVIRANIAFAVLWCIALLWCKFNSFDDPSSGFYNPDTAYEERYSVYRKAQVQEFLKSNATKPEAHEASGKFLCIGIPSINRTSEAFLSDTVGSLVQPLTTEERESIHIVVLLADKLPTAHFAYKQSWLTNLVDQVLVYDDPLSHAEREYKSISYQVREDGVLRGADRVESMRLDHSVLVEACRNKGSEYFALVEDDILASPDWFHKAQHGIGYVEEKSKGPDHEWLYLRLFFSEIFMGWNAEEAPGHVMRIAVFYVAAIGIFFALRWQRRRSGYQKLVPKGQGGLESFNIMAAAIIGLWIPAGIALFFLAGRITLHRFSPFPLSGVREMPNYGCCAQGLVFPQKQLPGVQTMLRTPPFQFPGDMLLEDYARDHGLKKWALDPSVMQHVGLKQSSEGPRVAEVWNFSFERRPTGPE